MVKEINMKENTCDGKGLLDLFGRHDWGEWNVIGEGKKRYLFGGLCWVLLQERACRRCGKVGRLLKKNDEISMKIVYSQFGTELRIGSSGTIYIVNLHGSIGDETSNQDLWQAGYRIGFTRFSRYLKMLGVYLFVATKST